MRFYHSQDNNATFHFKRLIFWCNLRVCPLLHYQVLQPWENGALSLLPATEEGDTSLPGSGAAVWVSPGLWRGRCLGLAPGENCLPVHVTIKMLVRETKEIQKERDNNKKPVRLSSKQPPDNAELQLADHLHQRSYTMTCRHSPLLSLCAS